MTLSRCSLDANEKADVKIDSQTEERLHTLSMLARHSINGVENHAKSLLMTVSLAQWC